MDIVNRLKYFLETEQIAITQFADNCGIPRPTLSQFLNLRNKKVSDDFIRKIHEGYPNLSVLWLMFGEGEMYAAGARPAAPSSPAAATRPETTEMQSMEFDIIDPGDETEGHDSDSPKQETTDRATISDADATQPATLSIDFGRSATAIASGAESDAESARQDAGSTDTPEHSPQSLEELDESASDAMSAGAGIPEEIASSITFHDEPKRKIVNIIVYYSDNSYESFGPMKH